MKYNKQKSGISGHQSKTKKRLFIHPKSKIPKFLFC